MKSVFFCYPNVHQLATSYKGTIRVRQGSRERGETKSHMKGDSDYISHSGAANLNHQNCHHLKVRFAFVAYCHLLSCPTFL